MSLSSSSGNKSNIKSKDGVKSILGYNLKSKIYIMSYKIR
jgi:hypothetical protein